MFETVAIPVWALLLIGLFAALSITERILGPSIRWFFRRRAERVVARLNKRLERPIEPFKLAHRHDMIQRLKYDPEVAHAIAEHAVSERVPEAVAFATAERYAREIVPSFSATAYFGIGTRLAKWVSNSLYRVQLGDEGDARIGDVDPDATVVYVMNHRSNMDYILVTWLASHRSALSYAVGEWARVWPLSSLIRTMGAFFIRRRSLNLLYRRVLSRYVQMATEGGVTQAVFPEGGLTLDGIIAKPKLGFLSYIVSGFDPNGRDVVFIPVALNYDRVLEDRVLVGARKTGVRRFRASIPTAIGFFFRQTGKWLRGKFYRFGYAAVSFGEPLSLADLAKSAPENLTETVGEKIMERIAKVVPVLPVPLVARIITDADGALDRTDIEAEYATLVETLRARGVEVRIPRDDVSYAVETALRMLTLRQILERTGERFKIVESDRQLLDFYANSIRHLFAA